MRVVCTFSIITTMPGLNPRASTVSLLEEKLSVYSEMLHLSSVCFIEYVCVPECIHHVPDALSRFPGLVAGSPGNDPHTPLPAPNVERMHARTHSRHAHLVHGLALMKDRKGRNGVREVEKVSVM